MRFSNDKRLNIVLKKRKIKDFKDLCKMTEDDFENILLTDPNIGNYKPKKILHKKNKEEDTDPDIPVV